MEKRSAKYIHFLWQDELKFTTATAEMIFNPQYGFDSSEHLFITPHQQVYDALKVHANAVLDTGNLFNKYGDCCEWIITHDVPRRYLGRIKRKYLKKIVWRTWGLGLFYVEVPGRPLRNWMKRRVNDYLRHQIQQFRLVGTAEGIGQVVDEIYIAKQFGDVETMPLSYLREGQNDELLRIMGSSVPREDNCVNVLIGHSGWEEYILKGIDQVSEFCEKDMKVHFVLSYGRADLIEEIRRTAKEKLGQHAEFQEEFLPYGEYFEFLRKMDIFILDSEESIALGNILALLCLKKKIFLNRNGVLKQAFENVGLPFCCTDEIVEMGFERFSQPATYPESTKEFTIPLDMHAAAAQWKGLFSMLEKG